jgi:hypothetical protein
MMTTILRTEHTNLGTLAASRSSRATHHTIRSLEVKDSGYGVLVAADGTKSAALYLTARAGLELVKALIDNLPALFLAADDDLAKKMRMLLAAAEREGEAIAEALKGT